MSSEFTADSKTAYNSDYSTKARYIASHVKRHWWVGILLLMGAFSNAALASAVPIFIGQMYDMLVDFRVDVMAQDSALRFALLRAGEVMGTSYRADIVTRHEVLQFALLMTGAIVGSQALRAVLQLMRNFSAEVFAQRIERDVRDELYASLLGKGMRFHDMRPVGEIMARVTNDVRELNFMFNPGFNLIVGSGMFLILPVVASPLIHPQLIIVPLIFVVLHVYVQVNLVRDVHPIAQQVRESFGKMNSRLAEALEGLQVVKGTAQEDQEVERFRDLTDTVRDHYIEQGEIEARYLSFFLLGLTFAAALLHGKILFDAGAISQGDVVKFVGQIYLFGFPVFTSLFSLSRIASGYASAGRILELITEETDLDQNETGYSERLDGSIVFENVTFGYIDGTPVLKDISFEVKPGQTVAIVGQTGSGKSTITKLINRTYDTDKGRVLVDGVDVREWKMEALRSQISIIEQDIFLFSRSVADNISFATDDASRAVVIDAATKAQAHDFIMEFPENYDTKIGQRGMTLSGGQRQRLAIARAFESDPPVLILDDSTSAIDSATEDKIQKAIWSAAEGRTTIIITHRLSQIRWADHIIVLKKGEVVAQGKHDDLLQSSQAYRRIFARYDEPQQDDDETLGDEATTKSVETEQ